MQKKISIIVPIYCVEQYLNKCIESIINQTYKNIEIILVDDGSPDMCPKICDDFAQKDKRIKVIHKINGGLSSARNAGLDIAMGEYVAFVDSDDWINENYIECLYELCEREKCEIAQCGFQKVIDEDNCCQMEKRNSFFFTGREFSYATYNLLSWQCNLVWNKLYKKNLFNEIRFPVGRIHEDDLTTYKIIWKASRIGYISSKLYYYRQRVDSIIGCLQSLKHSDAELAYCERKEFYINHEEIELSNLVQEDYEKWISSKPIFDNRHFFVFPFQQIIKNSKIVLYGAGDVGKQYFQQITNLDYCSILAWVDQKYLECRKQGIPVESTEVLFSVVNQCDYVVIAINNIVVVKQIKENLMKKYNVERKKIIYLI